MPPAKRNGKSDTNEMRNRTHLTLRAVHTLHIGHAISLRLHPPLLNFGNMKIGAIS